MGEDFQGESRALLSFVPKFCSGTQDSENAKGQAVLPCAPGMTAQGPMDREGYLAGPCVIGTCHLTFHAFPSVFSPFQGGMQ